MQRGGLLLALEALAPVAATYLPLATPLATPLASPLPAMTAAALLLLTCCAFHPKAAAAATAAISYIRHSISAAALASKQRHASLPSPSKQAQPSRTGPSPPSPAAAVPAAAARSEVSRDDIMRAAAAAAAATACATACATGTTAAATATAACMQESDGGFYTAAAREAAPASAPSTCSEATPPSDLSDSGSTPASSDSDSTSCDLAQQQAEEQEREEQGECADSMLLVAPVAPASTEPVQPAAAPAVMLVLPAAQPARSPAAVAVPALVDGGVAKGRAGPAKGQTLELQELFRRTAASRGGAGSAAAAGGLGQGSLGRGGYTPLTSRRVLSVKVRRCWGHADWAVLTHALHHCIMLAYISMCWSMRLAVSGACRSAFHHLTHTA